MNRFAFVAFSLFAAGLAGAANIQTVRVPMADVWNESVITSSTTHADTLPADKRETQILFGEQVSVLKIRGEWALIEAIEQMEYTHHSRWEGYPGWIQKSAVAPSRSKKIGQDYVVVGSAWVPMADTPLAFGTHFKGLPAPGGVSPTIRPEITLSTQSAVLVKHLPLFGLKGRDGILRAARQFMGTPYLWGGMSPNGIDCSGLVHMAYRANDRRVPRDAHDQWMMAQPVKRAKLKPGDLIFSAAAATPKKITHVVIYAGHEKIIEAPQTGMTVHEITFADKYGKPFSETESGQKAGDRILFFGTFFVPGT